MRYGAPAAQRTCRVGQLQARENRRRYRASAGDDHHRRPRRRRRAVTGQEHRQASGGRASQRFLDPHSARRPLGISAAGAADPVISMLTGILERTPGR